MILIIDNYDSFTYNLEQMLGAITPNIKVIRNDEMTMDDIKKLNPSSIILSPGPGYPKDAGVCEEVIRTFLGVCPIMGVCLGHQAICEVFGGKIIHGKEPVHGKASNVHVANGSPIFKGLAPLITAARYHSLVVDRKSLPDEILVIAEDSEGTVMAIKHRDYDVYGVQFHPESILTPQGHTILENFARLGGEVE